MPQVPGRNLRDMNGPQLGAIVGGQFPQMRPDEHLQRRLEFAQQVGQSRAGTEQIVGAASPDKGQERGYEGIFEEQNIHVVATKAGVAGNGDVVSLGDIRKGGQSEVASMRLFLAPGPGYDVWLAGVQTAGQSGGIGRRAGFKIQCP